MSSNPMTNSQQPIDALAGKLKRTELQHSASSIPGREIVQVRTEIPAGGESGWHMHPGEEVGYILAGTVEMMIQGKPTPTLHVGDPFLKPSRTPLTTRWTWVPRRGRCSPPTSSKWAAALDLHSLNMSPAASSHSAAIISLRNNQKNCYDDSTHFSLNKSSRPPKGDAVRESYL